MRRGGVVSHLAAFGGGGGYSTEQLLAE